METIFDNGLIWWITVIEIPVISSLFWFTLKTKQEHDHTIRGLRAYIDAVKLDIAHHYASLTEMKDLEKRLVSHLSRIEQKLDVTALKTESLIALRNNTPHSPS